MLSQLVVQELDQIMMVGEDMRAGPRRQGSLDWSADRSAFVATLRVAVKAGQVAAVGNFDLDVMHCPGRNEPPVSIALRFDVLAVAGFGRLFGGARSFDRPAHCWVHVIPSVNYRHDCLLVAQAFSLRVNLGQANRPSEYL
jgi:hypothetical protein